VIAGLTEKIRQEELTEKERAIQKAHKKKAIKDGLFMRAAFIVVLAGLISLAFVI
jgi:hypothetical protein